MSTIFNISMLYPGINHNVDIYYIRQSPRIKGRFDVGLMQEKNENKAKQFTCCGNPGVVDIVAGFGSIGVGFKFYESAIGIGQEGHPEYKVLQCYTKSLVHKRVCSSSRHSLNQHV